jgi:ParB family chromosome partitioning protein
VAPRPTAPWPRRSSGKILKYDFFYIENRRKERSINMAKERGLGKGLGALLGDAALQAQQEGQGALSLPISQVQPGLNQPRKRFDEEALADLADSIRTHGIIQPLTVRRLASGYYQIIAGERRWRAAKQAGLKEVPAVVIEADDKKVMELGLIENLQREDLNPIEEAAGYQVLMDTYGLTQEEVSQRVGKSRPAVANALRLLDLPDPVKQLLEEGRLSAGHARAVLSAPNKSLQRLLAQRVIDDGLSVRQTEALAKRMAQEEAEGEDAKAKPADPYKMYRDAAAKELSASLGRKVSIVQGAKKGKVELEYYDDNDLNDLLDLLEQVRAKKVPAPSAKGTTKGGTKA